MATAGNTIAKLFVELGFKGEKVSSGTAKAGKEIKGLQHTVQSAGNMIGSAMKAGFAVASAAMAAFGASAAITGAKFEQAMTLVGVLSGETGDALERLENRARTLGSTTAFTATEAAEGMQALARAGLTADEIMQATGQALFFAGANATTMERSTNLLASTMASFNLGAHESARIVDVYTAAVNNSLLDTTSLAEAMKYAGSVGAAFGMTLEETTAAVAMFRNMGLEGSLAGTNFRMAMIQAAKATERKKAVLQKYGLTMADINPEMFTFAEIMETVAERNIGAADSIEIFGARAGANISQIAAEIGSSSERWQKVNDAIGSSAGLTEQNYVTMMDTVVGQWDILKSVVQEFQLTLFEDFGEGLKELLMALQELVLFTTQLMSSASGGVAGDWNDSMISMADSIRENKASIAAQIQGMLEAFTDLGQAVLWVIKHFRTLASILVSMWAGAKILAFIGWLGKLATASVVASGAVSGLNYQFFLFSKTLGPVIVAVTAAVWLFNKLRGGMSDAEAAAKRLEEQQTALAAAIDESNAATQRMFSVGGGEHENALHNLELQLGAREALSNVYKREIELVRGMSDAQKQVALDAGELIQIQVDGETAFVSTAMAARLAVDETAGMQQQLTSSLQANTEHYQEQADIQNALANTARANIDDIADRMARARFNPMENYARNVSLHGVATTDFWVGQLERAEQLSDSIQLIGVTYEQMMGRVTGIQGVVHSTQQAMERDAQQRRLSLQDQELDERLKRWKKLQKDRLAAQKRTDKLIRDSISELAAANGETLVVWKMALEDRLTATREAFNKERDLWRGNAAAIEEIERNRDETVRRIRQATARASLNDLEDLLQDQHNANTAVNQTELEALRVKHREALIDARRYEDEVAAAHAEGSGAWFQAMEDGGNRVHSLMEAQAEELRLLQVRSTKERVAESVQVEMEAREARLPEYLRLERELARELAALEGDVDEERQAVVAAGNAQRLELRRQLGDEVANLLRQEASEEVQLTAERDAILRRIPEDMAEERAAVTEFYRKKMEGEEEESATLIEKIWEKTSSFIERVWGKTGEFFVNNAENIKKSFDTMFKDPDASGWEKFVAAVKLATSSIAASATIIVMGFQSAVQLANVARGAFSRVMDVLAAVSGFAFSLRDAVADVTGQMKELNDLEAQIAVGEITTAEYLEAIKDLPKTAAEAAQIWVTELIAGALLTVQTFVEAAPAILSELVAQLPSLLNTIADSLPAMIQIIADSIGPIVKVVTDAAPAIMNSLVSSLPILLDAIIAAIPSVLQTLLGLIPSVLSALSDVFVTLMESLPAILQALIDAIPTVVDSLVAGIVNAIPALLQVIPPLLSALIKALPELFLTIVDGFMNIVLMVAEQLPVLILALVELIPALITAVVDSLPVIVQGIIGALPQIITAIISAIPLIMGAVILMIPEIIKMIVLAIPDLLKVFFVDFIGGLYIAAKTFAVEVAKGLWQFFKDVFKEIVTLGVAETQTFGDTPGVIQAGSTGMTAGFAPNDYIVAAQNKQDMLDQILKSMTGGMSRAMSTFTAPSLDLPSIEGLGPAVMQAAGSMGGGGQPMRVTVTAEGKTLDDVLYIAGTRGGTPKLKKSLRKASGATVGFNRGRYSNSS
jgi:TP901 family phage tail tape measure protein